MTSEPALTFTEKDRTELAMLADDYDAVPNAHDGRLIARAAAYIEQLESALRLIATPPRPDGTYNRSREACEELARAYLAADGPAPAEEARAIEAHICLDCGTIYDHPTVCGLNGVDSPTVPVRDAIQSREPAPAVREEARADDCPFCDYKGPSGIVARYDREGYLTEPIYLIEPLNPVTEGHVLVIPERHVDHFLSDTHLTGLCATVAADWARKQGFDNAYNLIASKGKAATQTVGHLHLHLVPRREGDGLALPWDEPAPAASTRVREEARVEALKAALEWVADNYPAAITAMPTSLFRPLRESPVESSQEARRVCTCNAIDTPFGPAPDEKTPGCPVHSPAPAEEDREQLRRGARQDAAHHREATRVARAEGRDAG